VLKLANLGLRGAMEQLAELRPGLNTHGGRIVHPAVAAAFGREPAHHPFST
jgi:alanine dehydrogenase